MGGGDELLALRGVDVVMAGPVVGGDEILR